MRLERISLIVAALLVLTGCSVNRQTRQSDAAFHEPSPVLMPLRHADQYDPNSVDTDFSSEGESRPRTPPVPMREPVPALPAGEVSRVKSVSWSQPAGETAEHSNSGTNRCRDGFMIGRRSPLPPEYFGNSGTQQTQPMPAPGNPGRERLTVVQIIRGWNLTSKKCHPASVRSGKRHDRMAREQGCCTAEGCAASSIPSPIVRRYEGGEAVQGNRRYSGRSGSLADPVSEFGWENPAPANHVRNSPNEIPDLPLEPKFAPDQSPNSNLPGIEVSSAPSNLPLPESASELPAVRTIAPAITTPPHISPDAGKKIVQPPLWPRLSGQAANSVTHPQVPEVMTDDSSLPLILPGRSI